MAVKIGKILTNHWTIIFGIFVGIIIGLISKPIAQKMIPLGDIYLSLFQMCVLPIMISAVISSFANLLKAKIAVKYLRLILVIFLTALSASICIGVGAALLVKPGSNLNTQELFQLAQQVKNEEKKENDENKNQSNLISLTQKIIPKNIFNSIVKEDNLPILFFCILFGIALGLVPTKGSEHTIHLFETIFNVFLRLVGWIMYGLPFGLCFLFAGLISHSGFNVLFFLGKFIALIYCTNIFMIVISYVITAKQLNLPLLKVISALKIPTFIALGTQSSFATLPSLIKSLNEELKIDLQVIDLVVPLAIILAPIGSSIRYAFVAMFLLQFYGQPIHLNTLLIIFTFSVLATVSTPGTPYIASVGLVSIVLTPLGLPVAVGIAVLLAVDPIIDPIATLANVNGYCCITSILSRKMNFKKNV